MFSVTAVVNYCQVRQTVVMCALAGCEVQSIYIVAPRNYTLSAEKYGAI